MTAPYVEYRSVSKSYDGRHLAIANLDCAIRKGEFLTFLGPSGSGKTTALMILAGFETPTAGDVLLNGRTLARTPPHKRNMGVVFQSYALFPHMTVAENIAFPLTVRGIGASERRDRVARALDLVALSHFGARRPAELSGGQQQRVAFARALIFDPDLVLMDEPLGALDKSLREQLQLEIKRIQARLGLTVVYVTHDQVEALTMSDRIAVFDRGTIRQLATPQDLYEEPQSAFVAQFVGHNNSLSGVIQTVSGSSCTARTSGGSLVQARLIGPGTPGCAVTLAIRPECIALDARRDESNAFEARVREIIYHGDHVRIRVAMPGGESLFVKADRLPRAYLQPDAAVTVGWSSEDCRAFSTAEHESIAA
jgi:putative spermidine/putrescine transport system ATP-binding protein